MAPSCKHTPLLKNNSQNWPPSNTRASTSSTQWRLLHQPHSTRAVQSPGHKHPPWEAESLRLEPPWGGLDSRPAGAEGAPTLPQGRRLARDKAPREGELPHSGQLPPPPQGDRPRPWQQSCWSGDHTCPPFSAAWLRTGAQQAVV